MAAPAVVLPHTASRGDWLAARRRGIGSSDIAKLAGLSKWGGPLSVYYDKTDLAGQDVPPSEAAEIGLALEPTLAKLAAGRLKRKLARVGLVSPPAVPWMLASLDRVTVIGNRPATSWANFDGIVELKTALGWSALDWDDTDGGRVPDAYYTQVQWQLRVTGLPTAHLVALAGPSIRIYTVEPDLEYQLNLEQLATRFWHDNVLAGVPPAADDLEATTSLLRDRWTPDESSIVIAPAGDWFSIRDDYSQAREALTEAEALKRGAQNRARQLLGVAEALVFDGMVVATWKADKNGTRALRIPDEPKPLPRQMQQVA